MVSIVRKTRLRSVVGSLPVISQAEVLFSIIIMLMFFVAFGAATFVILALSKILDLLPIDFDVVEYVDKKRDGRN